MIDFVGAPSFLRIALRVALATMHFHILALTGLFLRNFFRLKGFPGNNLAPMKIVLGVQGISVKLIGSCFIKYCTVFCI